VWNVALWNSSFWASGKQTRFAWQGALGYGFCASLRINTISTAQSTTLYSIDYAYEPGAVL